MALSFDEVSLQSTVQFHQGQQAVYGPHEQAQVVLVRGILKPFKQPIYFAFDEVMTDTILFDLIDALQEIGLQVESVTSDMGAKNMALWRQLDIRPGNSNFSHRGHTIQVFADVPHLLKLTRNHLLDQGYVLKSGSLLVKDDLQQILEASNGELRVHHKLSHHHFECKGSQRQRVRLAAQLLSRTTACAMRLIAKEKKEQADMIELLNNVFDILNTNSAEGHKEYDYALGWESKFKKFVDQQAILLQGREEIEGMRTINTRLQQATGRVEASKAMLPFQRGWLVTIDAALELVDKLKRKYNATFLLTTRINQDALENLFSRIRYIGGADTHPGSVEFMSRLRLLVLGQSSEYIVEKAPVKTDSQEDNADLILSQQLVEGVGCEEDHLVLDDVASTEVTGEATAGETDCSTEGEKYVAGYIAFKFKDSHPELSQDGSMEAPVNTPWIDLLSYGGGLMRPSPSWFLQFQRLEGEFHNMHGQNISRRPRIIQDLEKQLVHKFPEIPQDIIKFYSKTRTFIRIKFLKCQHKTSSEMLRNQKKMKHFTS